MILKRARAWDSTTTKCVASPAGTAISHWLCLLMRIYAVICAQSRKTTGIDVSPANIPSSGQVVDASPPLPAPDMPPLISAPKSPPSLPALLAAETFTFSPLQAHSTTPLPVPELPSTLSPIGASPPLPKGSSFLPQIEGSPSLLIPDTPPQLPAPAVLPSPARYCPAPLTIVSRSSFARFPHLAHQYQYQASVGMPHGGEDAIAAWLVTITPELALRRDSSLSCI